METFLIFKNAEMLCATKSGPSGLEFDSKPCGPGYIKAYSPAASTNNSVSVCCISVPLIFKIDDSAPGCPPFSRADSNLNYVISRAETDISNSATFFSISGLSSSDTIFFNLLSCLIDVPIAAIPNLSWARRNLA